MTATIDTLFERLLLEAIAADREERRQRMELGSGIDDYASYQRTVGYCAALRDVAENIVPFINKQINDR